jgi:hypothetical protein
MCLGLGRDIEGFQHTVRGYGPQPLQCVTGGLTAFRDSGWATEIWQGRTMLTVVVKQPEVEHKVRMRDFEA